MTTSDDVHLKAGKTLGLAQKLEMSLTIPILMLAMLESGMGKDLTPKDVLQLIREDKARERPVVKLRTMDEKFRERMRAELINVAMLVKNGTMGDLRTKLQSYLRISPGGPPAPLDELRDALEARNYVCHEFFKEYGADMERGEGLERAISRLNALQADLEAAITFCDRLAATLHRVFPKTFEKRPDQIY